MPYLPSEVTEKKVKSGKTFEVRLDHCQFCIYQDGRDPRTFYIFNIKIDSPSWGLHGCYHDIFRWVDCIAWQRDASRMCLWCAMDSFEYGWCKRHGFSVVDLNIVGPEVLAEISMKSGHVWMEKTR